MLATVQIVKNCEDFAPAFVSDRQDHAKGRLTRTEARLLDYLATHAGRYVSADELVDALWNGFATANLVRVHVKHLREKLGEHAIAGGYGMGYRVSQGRADELNWRCGRCGRAIANYGETWTCYGCGANGDRARFERSQPMERHVECAYCGGEVVRAISDQAYEQRRRPGARVFCSLQCASKWRWTPEGREEARRKVRTGESR